MSTYNMFFVKKKNNKKTIFSFWLKKSALSGGMDLSVFVSVSTAMPAPVILIRTTTDTEIRLTDLLGEYVYNISVAAATGAGYGEPVFIQVTTCE